MNIKIADLMVRNVVTTEPHKSIGHIKEIMTKNHISCVPVVNSDNEPVGVVTTNDFKMNPGDSSPVSQLLSGHVYTVPAYNDVSVAAKVMRKHHFHHLIVTHEKEIVGIVSSFDLLSLLDEHKFTMKNPPTPKKKRNHRD
ncbi:cyclic nucleotide-binding/CBS domain-containing protein [Roseivirga sp. E12]|uniref:CBS domain-containing protein n=1 Tax=Roseivirga sp. E12 TaxID=2819237 RepID=UPI001ABC1D5E|nr:CBS domain-containing protein [Roseivirga sp. E12]MBO3697095.1 CBS domain-containing protein [Roseivirga sp. E12]